tara:strand:+ start:308 stop:517 length:210 start_codon:yes stop_codon:yes gene_type:complete
MKPNPLFIAIAVVRELIPIIQDVIKDVNEAKEVGSPGGRRITNEEKVEIATDAVLAVVPKLHDLILKHI